jgi:hypothetical protein
LTFGVWRQAMKKWDLGAEPVPQNRRGGVYIFKSKATLPIKVN